MLKIVSDRRARLTEHQRKALRFMRLHGSNIMLIGQRVVFANSQAQVAWEAAESGYLTKQDALWLSDHGYLIPTSNTDTVRVYQRVP